MNHSDLDKLKTKIRIHRGFASMAISPRDLERLVKRVETLEAEIKWQSEMLERADTFMIEGSDDQLDWVYDLAKHREEDEK